MISIRQPLFFTEIGQKENQEDSLYPLDPSPSSRVFVLCDGMGGHDNGEVASSTVSDALGSYLRRAIAEKGNIDINTFKEGLAAAYKALDEIEVKSAKTPGTTMTCLCLNENSYLVAHIGDSRIYHIRPSLYNPALGKGGIMYKSSDHSLVNELVKAGELTKAQARNYPHKNIITRAMQPRLSQPYKADAYIFSDIQGGDYFFMCCDGVLERLTNRELCRIIADPSLDDEGKLQAIKSICDGKTKDNYTCWLIPVDKVVGTNNSAFMPGNNADDETSTSPMAAAIGGNIDDDEPEVETPVAGAPLPEPQRDSALMRTLRWLTDAAVLLALIFSIWMLADVWRAKQPDKEAVPTDTLTEKQDTTMLNKELAQEDSTVTAAENSPEEVTPPTGSVYYGKQPAPKTQPAQNPFPNQPAPAVNGTEEQGQTAKPEEGGKEDPTKIMVEQNTEEIKNNNSKK